MKKCIRKEKAKLEEHTEFPYQLTNIHKFVVHCALNSTLQ